MKLLKQALKMIMNLGQDDFEQYVLRKEFSVAHLRKNDVFVSRSMPLMNLNRM